MKHDLVVGADYENRQQNQGAFIDGTRQGGFYPADPVYGLLKPVGPVNNNNSDWRQHINSASGYLKDNIHLGHGLILAPGVRPAERLHDDSGLLSPCSPSGNCMAQ